MGWLVYRWLKTCSYCDNFVVSGAERMCLLSLRVYVCCNIYMNLSHLPRRNNTKYNESNNKLDKEVLAQKDRTRSHIPFAHFSCYCKPILMGRRIIHIQYISIFELQIEPGQLKDAMVRVSELACDILRNRDSITRFDLLF